MLIYEFREVEFGDLNSKKCCLSVGLDSQGMCRAIGLVWMQKTLVAPIKDVVELGTAQQLADKYKAQKFDTGNADAMLEKIFGLACPNLGKSGKIDQNFDGVIKVLQNYAVTHQCTPVVLDVSIQQPSEKGTEGHQLGVKLMKSSDDQEHWRFMDPNEGIFLFNESDKLCTTRQYFYEAVAEYLNAQYSHYIGGHYDIMLMTRSGFGL